MFLLDILFSIIEALITNIPGGLGRRMRRIYYGKRLAEMGPGVVFDCGVRIINPDWVRIGANTWIDNYVVILAGPAERDRAAYNRKKEATGIREGEVRIGKNCHIAPFAVLQGHGGILIKDNCGVASGCKLYSLSHHYKGDDNSDNSVIFKFTPMAPKHEQSLISSPIVMEDSTAIGLNSVLLPGTHIGEGAWIGSGSVIRGAVPPRSVWSALPQTTCQPIEPPAAAGLTKSSGGSPQP